MKWIMLVGGAVAFYYLFYKNTGQVVAHSHSGLWPLPIIIMPGGKTKSNGIYQVRIDSAMPTTDQEALALVRAGQSVSKVTPYNGKMVWGQLRPDGGVAIPI